MFTQRGDVFSPHFCVKMAFEEDNTPETALKDRKCRRKPFEFLQIPKKRAETWAFTQKVFKNILDFCVKPAFVQADDRSRTKPEGKGQPKGRL